VFNSQLSIASRDPVKTNHAALKTNHRNLPYSSHANDFRKAQYAQPAAKKREMLAKPNFQVVTCIARIKMHSLHN
jgi:hypothetical protein